jgi:hypothetical protein
MLIFSCGIFPTSTSRLTTKNEGGIPVSGCTSPLFVSMRQTLKSDSVGMEVEYSSIVLPRHKATSKQDTCYI